GAIAIGVPGWPLFAFWTASIERVRIVSTHSRSRSAWAGGVDSGGAMGARCGRWTGRRRVSAPRAAGPPPAAAPPARGVETPLSPCERKPAPRVDGPITVCLRSVVRRARRTTSRGPRGRDEMIEAVRAPDERFANLPDFPWEAHYREHEGVRLAHVDE